MEEDCSLTTEKLYTPTRVMALHALAYCERLFYLEEVEEIRLADASVYAGRTLHEELAQKEEARGELINLEVSCDKLGLYGKVDCLKLRDGRVVPYEHKKGRSWRNGKEHHPWDSDALQIYAYSMLVEKALGITVDEARIRYHSNNVTVRVQVDDEARTRVFCAIERADELRRSALRPPITSNDRLCIKCSLAPVCLPEEERLADDKNWEPIRLFPPERELKTLHVVEHGVRISRSGETFAIDKKDMDKITMPVNEIGSIVLHGYPQITTQAIHFAAFNGIPVHFLSAAGRYIGGFMAGAGPVQRRIRQYQALVDPGLSYKIARKLVRAKIESSIRYVLRATRKFDRNREEIAEPIQQMRNSLKWSFRAEGIDELRGHEGMASRNYFKSISALLITEVPEELRFFGRNRRPPKDRFNALLGFGYGLLYQAVLQAVVNVGLEPAFGFFHTPRSSAYPLVLDLMELFRLPLWDIPLIGSINRLQWDVNKDFEVTKTKVWLSGHGRKKAIRLFEMRLEETWKHPVIGYSLSYGRLLELETRLLEKEWSGKPGLFARMRIR